MRPGFLTSIMKQTTFFSCICTGVAFANREYGGSAGRGFVNASVLFSRRNAHLWIAGGQVSTRQLLYGVQDALFGQSLQLHSVFLSQNGR
jgi:hypothetical protein